MTEAPAGALNGVKVVDFGQYVAGPLLAQLLAENGADVVHVDPPGGPRLAGLPDAYMNRGKKRITLDLHRTEDLQVAHDLIETADVVVENFRPGTMDRFGLGAARMREADPRLVYCSLPGFAADDPRADTPAWEGVVLSATAGYRRLAEHWDWKGREHGEVRDVGRPLFTGIPIASNMAALLGALEVAVALLQRERTGRGTRIEVPLAEAMLEVIGFHLDFPGFVGGQGAPPLPFLGSFECADGRHVDQVPYRRFVRRFLEAAGVLDEWDADGLADMDRVFGDPTLRALAEPRFADLIRSRTSQEWDAVLTRIESPFARVLTPEEWLAHNHARASGTVATLNDPAYGAITMAGSAFHLSRSAVPLRPRSLPDGDRQAVLAGLHRRKAAHASVPDPALPDTAPLAGISVVELSQVVAGPLSGRYLADYGADVLKVANPAPDGNNGFHGPFTNRGKQTAFLDVQGGEDRRAVKAAVGSADVLLQNYAWGAAERYGLGYESLSRERPDLVYVSLSAYSRQGPWRRRRGHENQAVAVTGISSRYGGRDGWPLYQPYLVSDVGTGILGALSAVLGLLERHRSGQGQHISSSLIQVATLHQGIYLFSGTERDRLVEPTGTEARGWSAVQRLYEAADGWFYLGAHSHQLADLLRALGLEPADDSAADPDAVAAHRMAKKFRGEPVAHWICALTRLGIGIQPVRELSEVAHDPVWHRRRALRYGVNGEGTIDAPVVGGRMPPWPVREGAYQDPGPLGAQTTTVKTRLTTADVSTPI